MKKLTAEKCMSVINGLKWMAAEGPGMSIRDEYDIQAYEIALPILEQQERGEGEWIEWGGRSIPRVVRGRTVQVRYACGETTTEYSGFLNWGDGVGKAVVAYRIIPERTTNQNGE